MDGWDGKGWMDGMDIIGRRWSKTSKSTFGANKESLNICRRL